MNEILLQMMVASLIKSVKSPEKKAKLRPVCQQIVQSILLAYADDEEFLDA